MAIEIDHNIVFRTEGEKIRHREELLRLLVPREREVDEDRNSLLREVSLNRSFDVGRRTERDGAAQQNDRNRAVPRIGENLLVGEEPVILGISVIDEAEVGMQDLIPQPGGRASMSDGRSSSKEMD